MKKFPRVLAAIFATGTLTLTACGGGGAGTAQGEKIDISQANFTSVNYDQIKDGGTYVTPLEEISPQQNPHHADGTRYTSDLWEWYNPQMTLFDEKGTFTPNPEYIKEIKEENSGGNTRLTYVLNDKGKFNDDTPIDWRAYETTWKINNGKDDAFTPNSTDGYDRITSVTRGANDFEAVIEFDGIYPWWQGLFNQIAHPALADPANYNDYLKKVHPEWGAGPYKVDSVDFNKGEAVFVKNEKWWGRPGKLDKRIFRQMEDSASLNAFKNGEIDVTGAGNKERYTSLKDQPGTHLIIGPTPSTSLWTLNGKSEHLSDIKVREAFAYALNRAQIAKVRFNGIPYEEKTPGSLQLYPFQENYEDNFSAVIPQPDPAKAQKLLEEAGYTKGADGFFEKDGKKLTLRYILLGDSEVSRAMAQAGQKMLKDAGFDVQIDQRPSSEFSNVIKQRDFDIMPMAFSASDPFGMSFLGQTYLSDSQLNRSDTGTPELDAKIREFQKLPTREEQIKAGNELEKEALARLGIIPMFNGPRMVVAKDGFANLGRSIAPGFAVPAVETIGWTK